MKFTAGFLVAVILALMMLTVTQCKTGSVSPAIVSYSYAVPIINPPDTFQVAYNLSLLGNRTAHITFQDNGVWKIQVLSQSRATFSFINPADNSTIYIVSPDTVGFQGGLQYSFVAYSTSNDSIKGLYFVKFTKLPFLDYGSFSPRY